MSGAMESLTTDVVGRACGIFLALAYPGGAAAVPKTKQSFLALPPGLLMLDHIKVDSAAGSCCQVLANKTGIPMTLLVRLGCCHYPHLKLKAQLLDSAGGSAWIFTVDTHDAFSANCLLPPPDHPDAPAWTLMQAKNRVLKEQIESAWEQEGLATFNGMLRRELKGESGT
jgi:hypothetical protein